MAHSRSAAELQHDPVLAEVVRRLVRAYDPERIYLFGSRARITIHWQDNTETSHPRIRNE